MGKFCFVSFQVFGKKIKKPNTTGILYRQFLASAIIQNYLASVKATGRSSMLHQVVDPLNYIENCKPRK
jgi:hypothetical protein